MLNRTGVTKVLGETEKTILVSQDNSMAVSCIISDTGVTANAEGRKIVKKGTPLSGDITARTTPFTINGDSIVGIARNTVDVTDGKANGAVLLFGFVDQSKLDVDVQAMIKATGVKEKLNMIKFIV